MSRIASAEVLNQIKNTEILSAIPSLFHAACGGGVIRPLPPSASSTQNKNVPVIPHTTSNCAPRRQGNEKVKKTAMQVCGW